MKRKVLSVLLMSIFLSSMIGAPVDQKIYPVNSEPFQIITSLYIAQGMALPSTAGPHSGDELMRMLDLIEVDHLSSALKNIYNVVHDELYSEQRVVTWGLEAALEAYIHTDTTNFTLEEDWVRGHDERKPLFNIVLETFPSKHFYGYSEFTFNNSKYTGYDETTGTPTSLYFGKETAMSNLFFFSPGSYDYLDLGMPYRAFGAFGGANWSVQIGRDKLSWGAGKTGNFMLSDSLQYHNTGRFTTYNKNFKYSLVTSFFPHPKQYHGDIIEGPEDTTINDFLKAKRGSQKDFLSGIYMFLGHRLEGRLFKGKVGVAVAESMMYQSEDNTLDLRLLNPSMLYHNYYIRGNSNSLLTFDIDYSPIPHVNIYGQLAIDEFDSHAEPTPGETPNAFPSAMAFMLGVQTALPLHRGLFTASLEFVKTDPFLYLRDKGDVPPQKLGDWGTNFIVALRTHYSGSGTIYQEEFLGYPFGPDAIVINANAGYKEFGSWNLSTNLFYMWHGTHDKWTLWSMVQPLETVTEDDDNVPHVTTPTDKHWPKNNGDKNYQNRDSVARTFIFGVKGGYSILPGFDAYAQADLIHIVNPGNVSSNTPITDLQLTVGLSYTL